MKIETWLQKLHDELPDWRIWHTAAGWFAAPRIASPAGVFAPPKRLGPFEQPQQLREECQAWALHLPPIPRHIQTRGPEPQFCRWRERWAVLGPADLLPEHGEVTVLRWEDKRPTTVTLGLHVAARTVRHRSDSYTGSVHGALTRYVIAEIVKRPKRSGS